MCVRINNRINDGKFEYLNEQLYNEFKIRTLFYFPFRAEGLAGEIKDLQGQLADYNMVNSCSTIILFNK